MIEEILINEVFKGTLDGQKEEMRYVCIKLSRDFHWDGHVWRTFSIEMATGDCAKSSTML